MSDLQRPESHWHWKNKDKEKLPKVRDPRVKDEDEAAEEEE